MDILTLSWFGQQVIVLIGISSRFFYMSEGRCQFFHNQNYKNYDKKSDSPNDDIIGRMS